MIEISTLFNSMIKRTRPFLKEAVCSWPTWTYQYIYNYITRSYNLQLMQITVTCPGKGWPQVRLLPVHIGQSVSLPCFFTLPSSILQYSLTCGNKSLHCKTTKSRDKTKWMDLFYFYHYNKSMMRHYSTINKPNKTHKVIYFNAKLKFELW